MSKVKDFVSSKWNRAKVYGTAALVPAAAVGSALIAHAEEPDINSIMSTTATSVSTQILTMITTLAPIVGTIVAAVLAVTFGFKFIRKFAK
ncbi:MAG: hypothetical protein IJS41_00515 [Clostridia bacterium]|nr:hypothetical protein [Clostridia bacterium]